MVSPPTTASEAPAPTEGRRTPSEAEPLRIVLAGDSVMAGLVPPLLAAFEESGTATGRFVLTPSILRDPAVRFTWERQIEAFDPEVVVVLMGTWEAMIVEGAQDPGAPAGREAWAARYRDELLGPWVDLLSSGGAAVLWVGMPPVVDGAVARRIPALNAAFAALAAQRDDLTYIDPAPLAGPDGALLEVAEVDGAVRRLRQVDGLHLCPAGALLLAEPVLAVLDQGHGVSFGARWREGGWHDDETSPGTPTYPAASCPAPAGAPGS